MPTLLSLPSELRLRIYTYLWRSPPDRRPSRYGDHAVTARGALLRTCHFLRAEASPAFYGSLDLQYALSGWDIWGDKPFRMLDWLRELGEENVRSLRRLTVRYLFRSYEYVEIDLGTVPGTVSPWLAVGCQGPELERIVGEVRRLVEAWGAEGHPDGGVVLGLQGWEAIVAWLERIERTR